MAERRKTTAGFSYSFPSSIECWYQSGFSETQTVGGTAPRGCAQVQVRREDLARGPMGTLESAQCGRGQWPAAREAGWLVL